MRHEDLTDKPFGRLIAIRRVEPNRNTNLLKAMQGLGYVHVENARLMRPLSFPGAAFLPRGKGGRLMPSSALAMQPLNSSRKTRASVLWLCLCSCGKPTIVLAEKL